MKEEYDFSKARRRHTAQTPGKTRITIRIDNKLLDWFRDKAHALGGASYQTLINDALTEYVNACALETTLRRVIREELKAAG
jgi:uncharacterized protein (DUF4415 family)